MEAQGFRGHEPEGQLPGVQRDAGVRRFPGGERGEELVVPASAVEAVVARRERIDEAAVEAAVADGIGDGPHRTARGLRRRGAIEQDQPLPVHAEAVLDGPLHVALGVDRAREVALQVAALRHGAQECLQDRGRRFQVLEEASGAIGRGTRLGQRRALAGAERERRGQHDRANRQGGHGSPPAEPAAPIRRDAVPRRHAHPCARRLPPRPAR